ncbi:CHASE2 domain-containing protein [Acetobacter suratthaniensis]|uniref:CHASE2 domain-containing protein n=1 Tax=Acetobacter suratthaniensis TaxID=1502841 RepID=A0ABS3LME5_9PROT|nr:CHASE2 domain-containing protein [Acetobacter suratthaniensis]MBO1328546.1 CHASE2 domain-containing protein [Acetobacter suratthaniensis]MCX2566783.1 CHASE2 domain-containing protein [Acetobacter suratthaniensis]
MTEKTKKNPTKAELQRQPISYPIYCLLMILFWVLFKLFDPLAMESATKASSARFLSGLSDAFYGMQENPARDRIAVVEITDTDLSSKYFDSTWPLTYARHAELIDRMLDAKPAAIMIDVRFNAERSGESLHEAFDPIIARARTMGIPLLFARGKLDPEYSDLPAPLTDLQVINGWDMRTGFYPLLLAPPAPQTEEHSTSQKSEEAEEEAPKTIPVAAFAMYRALCANGWQKSCPADLSEHTFGQPLVERWGLRAPLSQTLYAKTDGCAFDARDKPFARISDALTIAARALFGYFSEDIRQNCQYHLTLPARYLDRNLEPNIKNIEPALKNRAVFYGTQINGDHDIVDVPMIGAVPGVQEHAMALDNLLTYNEDYFREPGEWLSWKFVKIDSAELLEFFVWMLFITYSYTKISSPTQYTPRKWKIIFSITALVLMSGIGCLYGMNKFHQYDLLLAFGLFCIMLNWYACSQNMTGRIAETISAYPLLTGLSIILLSIGLLGVDISLLRHSTYGIAPLCIAYAALAILLCISIVLLKVREHLYFGKLLLCVTMVAVMFVLNEDFLLWPMEDWVGFVLLWLALDETKEKPGFVSTLLEYLPKKHVLSTQSDMKKE